MLICILVLITQIQLSNKVISDPKLLMFGMLLLYMMSLQLWLIIN